MPDRDVFTTCRQSARQFEKFIADGGTDGKKVKKVKFSPDRIRRVYDASIDVVPKKARAKESSPYFGVRFRPDLNKWVAEIRVFEWNPVDKKVWLGTFETEEGAARAVDAARKLLGCRKNRKPNFPCAELAAYDEAIPPHLLLSNIEDDAMIKEVTIFVKKNAQEYAAGFQNRKASQAFQEDTGAVAVGLREQWQLVEEQFQVSDGTECFPPTSDTESWQLFSMSEDDMSPNAYSTNTYGNYESDGKIVEGTMSPPLYYTSCSSGPPSCSSTGTSPEDARWVLLHRGMWSGEDAAWPSPHGMWSSSPDAQQLVGGYRMVDPMQASWEDPVVPVGMMMMDQDQTSIDMDGSFPELFADYLFNDPGCHFADQVMDPVMNIFRADELQAGARTMYGDNLHDTSMFHQGLNTPFEYGTKVC